MNTATSTLSDSATPEGASPETTQPQASSAQAVADRIEATIAFGREHSMTDLMAVIPKDCFERSVPRQLLGLLVTLLAMGAAWTLLAFSPWWLLPVSWFLAGTAGWGMIVIAHECGHGSFSKNRRLNHFFGHLCMTPFLYPFHSWRLMHNHHHSNTNSIEKDIDWRPIPLAIYKRLPGRPRWVYRMIRTWFWWAGTLHQLFTQAFNLKHVAFEKDRDRAYVKTSITVVALFSVVFFPALIYFTGLFGVVKYFLVPWAISYGWFSLITLMHHTHPEVPFLDKRTWSASAGNLCMTMYCRFPRWMEFLGHDINVHVPHHVAPHIPFFHLRRAHAALAAAYPEHVREFRFSFSRLRTRLRDCHLYERKTRLYRRFSG